jgi:hypothetical protein
MTPPVQKAVSIISSAVASMVAGIVSPIALALLKDYQIAIWGGPGAK